MRPLVLTVSLVAVFAAACGPSPSGECSGSIGAVEVDFAIDADSTYDLDEHDPICFGSLKLETTDMAHVRLNYGNGALTARATFEEYWNAQRCGGGSDDGDPSGVDLIGGGITSSGSLDLPVDDPEVASAHLGISTADRSEFQGAIVVRFSDDSEVRCTYDLHR